MIPSNPYALIFLLCATSCFVAATIVMYTITGNVNARLSADQRFSYLGSYLAKNRAIAAAYRRLFPNGRLLLLYRVCVALGIMLMVLTAINDR